MVVTKDVCVKCVYYNVRHLLQYLTLELEVEVNLRPTVSRPVSLGVRRPSGTRDQFFFLLEISFRQLGVYYFVAPSLTRGRVCSLLYNCFWALPEQSLLGRSPAELTAIFYCLIWRLPQPGGSGSRIYIPQEQGGPVIPRALGSLFIASYDSQGLRCKYSNPPPHGSHWNWFISNTQQKNFIPLSPPILNSSEII
jgi:hypothetical protein